MKPFIAKCIAKKIEQYISHSRDIRDHWWETEEVVQDIQKIIQDTAEKFDEQSYRC